MQPSKFYYEIDPYTTDAVVQIGGMRPGVSLSISNLLSQLSGIFWKEKGINGEETLCVIKGIDEPFTLTMNTGISTYEIYPRPFVCIDCGTNNIFGPNPTNVRPGPRK